MGPVQFIQRSGSMWVVPGDDKTSLGINESSLDILQLENFTEHCRSSFGPSTFDVCEKKRKSEAKFVSSSDLVCALCWIFATAHFLRKPVCS